MPRCPDCHAVVDEDAIFCDQCGFRLKEAPRGPAVLPVSQARSGPVEAGAIPGPAGEACPACGYFNLPGEAFCSNCGIQLASAGIAASTPAPASPPASAAAMPSAYPSAAQVESPVSTRICPTCGAENPAGEEYCITCGFWLASQPAAVQPRGALAESQQPLPAEPAHSPFETLPAIKIPGRLFATASNADLVLPAKTEVILGRRDPERGIYPDVDLSAQGSASNSVSRQHARLVLKGSQLFIEDMNSTNSTYLNRQKLQPGQLYLLNHGDELRLGGVVLVYYA